jgi:hypothetical protein
LFVMRGGKLVEVGNNSSPLDPVAPFVQDDTLDKPIRFLASDKAEFYDSKSAYLRRVKAEGLSVVGNDLISQRPHSTPTDRITEEKILDRIEKAESILNDPSKYRARQEENIRRLERRAQLLGRRLDE